MFTAVAVGLEVVVKAVDVGVVVVVVVVVAAAVVCAGRLYPTEKSN